MSPQQRGEETRARLLEAAVECFAQKGYELASVADICQCANVSKGAFYHHFASKQALFIELIESWLAQLDEQLNAGRLGAQSIPEALSRMAAAARPAFQMTDHYVPMLLEFFTQARRDPAIWQAVIEPYRRYRTYFAQMIEAGVEEGSLRPVEADTVARVMVSLAAGTLLQAFFNPEGADWGQVAQDGIGIVLAGLRNPTD